MITQGAKEKLALFLHQFFDEIQFGSGGDSSNPYVNTLDVPITTSGTLTTTNIMSNDTTIDFTYTLSGTTLNNDSVQEIGIFGQLPNDDRYDELDNTTYDPSTMSESIMLIRIPIDPIIVKTAEQYEIVITMEVQ
jgi:hypothetical protein